MQIEKKLYSIQVLEIIKKDLINGVLVPGEKLSETQLSQRFGVSRAPIREALSFLQRDGLIVSNSKGKSIRKLSKKETYDIYLTGATLEAKAVSNTCHLLTESDFSELYSKLSTINDKMIQKAGHHELDEQFHRLLMKYEDNQVLINTSRQMASRTSKFLLVKYWQKLSTAESFYKRHLELIEILQKRDKTMAEEAIIEHYKVLAENIIKLIEDDSIY